jgi:hypothetical protein
MIFLECLLLQHKSVFPPVQDPLRDGSRARSTVRLRETEQGGLDDAVEGGALLQGEEVAVGAVVVSAAGPGVFF